MRNEVKILIAAMVKVWGENDKSKLAENVAIERAKAFEKEREKFKFDNSNYFGRERKKNFSCWSDNEKKH